MSMNNQDFVLASVNPPSVFNFYPSVDAAIADQERANSPQHGFKGYQYAPMTWDEFHAAQRAFYLGDPEQEITGEKFTEMFEVLPPMAMQGSGDFESFLMSEFYSVPYTHQYVKRGSRYFTKLVDATDKSTWMKP